MSFLKDHSFSLSLYKLFGKTFCSLSLSLSPSPFFPLALSPSQTLMNRINVIVRRDLAGSSSACEYTTGRELSENQEEFLPHLLTHVPLWFLAVPPSFYVIMIFCIEIA